MQEDSQDEGLCYHGESDSEHPLASLSLSFLLFTFSSLHPGLHASFAPPLPLPQLPVVLLSQGMTKNNTCNTHILSVKSMFLQDRGDLMKGAVDLHYL